MKNYTRRPGQTPAESEPDQSVFDIHAVLRALWRQWWVIAGTVTVALVLAITALSVREPVYSAASMVLIDPGADEVLDLRSALANRPLNASMVNSEIRVITSNRVLGRVVDELGLAADPVFVPQLTDDAPGFSPGAVVGLVQGAVRQLLAGDEDEAAGPTEPQDRAERYRMTALSKLAGKLDVYQVGTSYVVEIAATTRAPQRAAELANAVASAYIEMQREEKLDASKRAARWLSREIATLEDQVQGSADQVDTFRVQHGLADEGQVEQLSLQLERLRSSLAQAREARARLENDVVSAGGSLVRPTGGRADTDDETRRQLDAAIEREETLARSVAEVERQFRELVSSQARLKQLERQAEADRRLYERFLDELKEVDALGSFQQADARVIADALQPLGPTGPSSKLVLAFAGVLGGGFGVALIGLREVLRTAFRSREELEAFTGLPVLASLPATRAGRNPAGVVAAARGDPGSELAESLRTLRAAVFKRRSAHRGTVVMMASSDSGEGKSSLALALAHACQAAGKRVLVVDCDLRRPGFAGALKPPPAAVIAATLEGGAPVEKAITHDERLGVPVLCLAHRDSRVTTAATELLGTDRVGAIIEHLRGDYDIIVMDTPPLGPVTDAAVLGSHADQVLFCVRWARTSRAVVADGLRRLAAFDVPVDGLVFTRVNTREEDAYRSIPRRACRPRGAV